MGSQGRVSQPHGRGCRACRGIWYEIMGRSLLNMLWESVVLYRATEIYGDGSIPMIPLEMRNECPEQWAEGDSRSWRLRSLVSLKNETLRSRQQLWGFDGLLTNTDGCGWHGCHGCIRLQKFRYKRLWQCQNMYLMSWLSTYDQWRKPLNNDLVSSWISWSIPVSSIP